MATPLESRFIRLTDFCVVEYMFSSMADPQMTTGAQDIILLQNEHNNTHQIYNDNNSTTNNIQDNTVVATGDNTYMYIDQEKIPDYVDADDLIHKVETGIDQYAYDKVRVHFVTGFNFSEYEALVFSVKNEENDGKYNVFASILLTESIADGILRFNSKPLFMTDVLYDRYIDVTIPSIKVINRDYYDNDFVTAQTDGAILTANLEGGYSGFVENAPIVLSMDIINTHKIVYVDNVPYDSYVIDEHSEVSMTQVDEFSTFGGHIAEADDGDYIEVYATYNGGFPGELVSYLNSKNPHDNWIIVHQLSLFEQVGSSFIATSKSMFYQEDGFDEPFLIRPVIKYAANALSFSYDYIVRLINQRDGYQVIRSASMSSTEPKKYGRYIEPLPMSHVNPHKVYNKLIKKSFESDLMYIPDDNMFSTSRQSGTVTEITKKVYEPMFVNSNNVNLAEVNVNLNNADNIETLVYGQDELHIILNPFDNVFRFYVYERVNNKMKAFNLNVNDNYKLTFMNNGEEVSTERVYEETRGVSGELLFIFTSDKAIKILSSNDKNFYITTTTETGVETVFYHGVWHPVEESDYVKQIKTQKLISAIGDVESTVNDITRPIVDPALLNATVEIPGEIPPGA
jgi:hypothetical protein